MQSDTQFSDLQHSINMQQSTKAKNVQLSISIKNIFERIFYALSTKSKTLKAALSEMQEIGEYIKKLFWKPEKKALEFAIEHLSERKSAWKESEMYDVMMDNSICAIDIDRLHSLVEEAKAKGKLLTGKNGYEKYLTTDAILAQEKETIDIMKRGKGSLSPILSSRNTFQSGCTLNDGQKEAVKLIVRSTDKVIGIQGYAGTGKTHMLKYAKEIIEKQGYTVIGLAPSNSAARTLASETRMPAQTLHRFEFTHPHILKQKKKMVLIVDEASFVSTKQMNYLLKLSEKANLKLVLIGDKKQLEGVEAGKPFTELQRHGMEVAIMKEIVRQKDQDLKNAVIYSVKNYILGAVSKLGEDLREVEVKKGEDKVVKLCENAAKEWSKLSIEERKKTIIPVPSNYIRVYLNNLIRIELKKEGQLAGNTITQEILKSKKLTNAQMKYTKYYKAGDVIFISGMYYDVIKILDHKLEMAGENGAKFKIDVRKIKGEVFQKDYREIVEGEVICWTRNHKDGAVNSQQAKVKEIKNNKIKLELEGGKEATYKLDHPALRHIDYGYALTVHAAQGKTYKRVIGIIESKHKYLTTQRLFYIIISRAKQHAIVFTDNKKQLTATLISNDGNRLSALEQQGLLSQNKLMHKRNNTSEMQQSAKEHSITERILNSRDTYQQSSYLKHSMREVYYNLYPRLGRILPEFGFKEKNGYYISTTGTKADLSQGAVGKVYVYANNPGLLVDYTRGNKSIWDYMQQNHMRGASKAELMQYLCELAGLSTYQHTRAYNREPLPAPASPIKALDTTTYTSVDKTLLRDIHEFSKKCISHTGNEVMKYLQKRGYDEASIKAMELGYISSKSELAKHLRSLNWSSEKVDEAYKTLHFIGVSHKLLIPYKDSAGGIIGFASRNINYSIEDKLGKYMYTKGLSRNKCLLGLNNLDPNIKQVVLVEGLIDGLYAQSQGMKNVLALGGTGFNASQLKLLSDAKIEVIKLALDNDNAGREATVRIIKMCKSSKVNVKVVSFPEGIKDPDQLMREHGVNAFKKAVSQAKNFSELQTSSTSKPRTLDTELSQ